jgi:hypothetical protein
MPQTGVTSSITVRKYLKNISNWGYFLSYCQEMPEKYLKLGLLPQLLTGNA